MLGFVGTLLLCSIISVSTANYCQDNFTLGEFPKGVLRDTISLFTLGVVADFSGCSDNITIDRDDIRFWLWNKENPLTPIVLDTSNPVEIDGSKPVIFIIPGWLCNVTSDRVPQLRDAYLKRYGDANIIGVEWTTYSVDLYAKSFCYVPKIAPIVGEFVCKLSSDFSVDINKVHMIGHSMGGQMCGLVGQEVQSQCKQKLGRITGLDPAGPLYQTISDSRRLDASDAQIVDVIHTNQGQAGFFGSCGTVDYFPNSGYLQPGCLKLDAFTVTQLSNFPLSVIGCSHLRSADYLIESISSDNFIAKSCGAIPTPGACIVDLFNPSTSVMGEDYPEHPGTSHKYYLKTNGQSPFAKG